MCIVPRVTVKVLRSAKGIRPRVTWTLTWLKTMKNCYKTPSQKSGRGRLCVVVACLREINYNHRV